MAKPIKIWTGSEWVDIAIQAPSTSGLATTSALSAHEADTTNVHGIADTANLVLTNDARLSNSRTPTSHAASHGSAGSDSITIAQSQVTNLATDLSAKAPLASPTFTGTVVIPISTNQQTASYTLVLSDASKLIEMNVASANNLTVPLNSSAAFPIGTKIDILQIGAGQTTVVATGGVTINANPGLKLSGQWAAASLIKRGTDTWVLIGNISA